MVWRASPRHFPCGHDTPNRPSFIEELWLVDRGELKAARTLVRRLIGPLTLTDPQDYAASTSGLTVATGVFLTGTPPAPVGRALDTGPYRV
jgi:hypothetical protein